MTPLEIMNYLVDRFCEEGPPVETPIDETDTFYTRLHDILVQKYQLDVRKKVIETVQIVCKIY